MSEHGLTMQRRNDAGRLVVSVHGEIDLMTCELLSTELGEATKQSPEVLVDLSGVSFLDSAGIRVLVEAHQTAARVGHQLCVDNAHGWVERVLEVTGVRELLARPQ
ncbi:STAS domain-containing protein [Catellatospora sp. NPDC049609]|uniref:STAS domain-containing protein n=1 Tax=Catellatospora sp. NPDC049609 TaxID=3155505 RepID=UPI00343E36E0